MSENPARESEPKSKNPQVVERAAPQSPPRVCFARYFHGNAESSTSWPHAHTHACSVLDFTSSTITALYTGLNTYTHTRATVKHGVQCTKMYNMRICCMSCRLIIYIWAVDCEGNTCFLFTITIRDDILQMFSSVVKSNNCPDCDGQSHMPEIRTFKFDSISPISIPPTQNNPFTCQLVNYHQQLFQALIAQKKRKYHWLKEAQAGKKQHRLCTCRMWFKSFLPWLSLFTMWIATV